MSLPMKLLLAAVLLPLAGMVAGTFRLMRRVDVLERDFAPLVEAMERFRSEKGAYPRKLEELVPSLIAALPRCPTEDEKLAFPASMPSDPADLRYIRRADDSYDVGCSLGVMVFPQDAYYVSREKRWQIFD